MAQLLNLPPHLSTKHVFNGHIILGSFLESVTTVDVEEACWPRRLTLCLFAQFLLVSTSGECDLQVLCILSQVESGLNPLPIILAEIIFGLDNFTVSNRLTGSPMLLEVTKWVSISLFLLFYHHFSSTISFFSDMTSREVEDAGSSQGLLKVQGETVAESSLACSSCQRNRLVGYLP